MFPLQQTLSSANGGNLDALNAILEYTKTRHEDHRAILYVSLKILAQIPIPTDRQLHREPAVQCALEILARICHSTPNDAPFKAILLENRAAYLPWIAHISRHGQRGSTELALAAWCLFEVVTLDPALKATVLSTNGIPNSILSLWIKGLPQVEGLVLLDYESNIKCPYLSLAYHTIRDRDRDDPEDHITRAITSLSKRKLDSLGYATQAKVGAIIGFYTERKLGAIATLYHLVALLDVTTRSLQTKAHWTSILEKGNVLGAVFDGLNTLTEEGGNEEAWDLVVSCFKFVFPWILVAGPYDSKPRILLQQIVAGGRYLILFRSLLHLRPRTQAFNYVLETVGEIGTYTVIPCISSLLWPSFEKLNQIVSDIKERTPFLERRMDGFVNVVLCGRVIASEDYARLVPAGLCDNIQCPGLLATTKTRQCSACRSVIYCSEDCQIADWAPHHRRECRVITLTRKRRELRIWIPFSLKGIYLGFLEDSCISHSGSIESKAQSDYPNASVRSLVTMLNFRAVPVRFKVFTFEEYRTVAAPVPSHLQPRIEAFIQDCQDDPELALIETTLAHGLVKINIIARAKGFPRSCRIVGAIFSFWWVQTLRLMLYEN
ncbi:hypothetical protein CC1G_11250 [Coprinopsis cinerea okayama7|uniref:MYND-type domain-containing protein n=1 Tax=Coprinopsis cinerea (strain Okayama-7 / 130 / ATCC MYA-4618 / FGSC 9003) TaxID=240176 RepID=A8NLQ4_COPC7|nr:hypothetical protein CC1G_11250 [Coprinopsis cinerea okayama7\|eukprot:XP_001834751.1 hypothetical protein CC1G_11250 [Coprinopsis cinerea okayama7\